MLLIVKHIHHSLPHLDFVGHVPQGFHLVRRKHISPIEVGAHRNMKSKVVMGPLLDQFELYWLIGSLLPLLESIQHPIPLLVKLWIYLLVHIFLFRLSFNI